VKQLIIGHRGAAGLAPENTLKSFQLALDLGLDAVECDIHTTKDKQLVVIHDNTLERTTNGKGWVVEHTLKQLKILDAGKGEQIPSFKDVYDLVVKKYSKKLIVEIKGGSWKEAKQTEKALEEFIQKYNVLEDKGNFEVHSLWHGTIKIIKEKFPSITTVAVLDVGLEPEYMVKLATKVNANGLSISNDFVSKEIIQLAHKNNLFVDAWTAEDEETFKRIKQMGVAGLIRSEFDE